MLTLGSLCVHRASRGQRQDLNPGSLNSEHVFNIDWKNSHLCVYARARIHARVGHLMSQSKPWRNHAKDPSSEARPCHVLEARVRTLYSHRICSVEFVISCF